MYFCLFLCLHLSVQIIAVTMTTPASYCLSYQYSHGHIVLWCCLSTTGRVVSRARRLKYVWSRLARFCKRRRNVGDTNQIAEHSIITKLLRISHMTVCPFQTRCYREESVSESCELAMLRPNQERVISLKINDGFRRWSSSTLSKIGSTCSVDSL